MTATKTGVTAESLIAMPVYEPPPVAPPAPIAPANPVGYLPTDASVEILSKTFEVSQLPSQNPTGGTIGQTRGRWNAIDVYVSMPNSARPLYLYLWAVVQGVRILVKTTLIIGSGPLFNQNGRVLSFRGNAEHWEVTWQFLAATAAAPQPLTISAVASNDLVGDTDGVGACPLSDLNSSGASATFRGAVVLPTVTTLGIIPPNGLELRSVIAFNNDDTPLFLHIVDAATTGASVGQRGLWTFGLDKQATWQSPPGTFKGYKFKNGISFYPCSDPQFCSGSPSNGFSFSAWGGG